MFLFTATSLSICWNSTATTVAGVTGSPGLAAHQLKQPFGIKLDASNTLYIVDRYNNRVQKWPSSASNGTTVAGQSNGASGVGLSYLSEPAYMQLASNGDIYITEVNNHRVVKWASGASVGTLIAGTGRNCVKYFLMKVCTEYN